MNKIFQSSWLESTDAQGLPKPDNYFNNLLKTLDIQDSIAGWPDNFGNALRNWAKNTLPTPIKILSLFSGGGGLDIGFHDAGFHAVQMIEFEPRYIETLRVNTQKGKRFEGSEPLCIDIRDFHPSENLHVDFIIGGPPCQTFSAAGRRVAGVSGLDDPRGNLFREYVRILNLLNPRGFLFENVYGIIGAQGGKAWQEILSTFESAGYTISYRILDAADYGVPQHRERLIIVGVRDKPFAFPRPTHGPDSIDQRPFYTPGIAVYGIEDEKPNTVGGRYGHLLKDIPPGLNYSFYTEEMGHPTPHFSWRSKFSDLLYKADPEMPVRTIKAQGGQYTGPFHWENRAFSIGELKRLQTFPDDYDLAGSRLTVIEQIGNSVTPQLGRILALAVLDQVFDVHLPFPIQYLSPQEILSFRQRKAALTTLYKEKAKNAIIQLQQNSESNHTDRTSSEATTLLQIDATNQDNKHVAFLGSDFSWRVSDKCDQDYPWNVQYILLNKEESLDFYVGTRNQSSSIGFPIAVEVNHTGKWNLPVEKVHLFVQELSPFLLTASWKAFEYYLASEGIKADLVQLNGYYQYEPKITIKVLDLKYSQSEEKYLWDSLKSVLEGKGTRKILSLGNLAALWDMSINRTIEALIQLRSLGYEIRSEYTNSQIPGEHVLIPYAFPTLNPKSVQLRKTLFPAHFQDQWAAKKSKECTNNRELWPAAQF